MLYQFLFIVLFIYTINHLYIQATHKLYAKMPLKLLFNNNKKVCMIKPQKLEIKKTNLRTHLSTRFSGLEKLCHLNSCFVVNKVSPKHRD